MFSAQETDLRCSNPLFPFPRQRIFHRLNNPSSHNPTPRGMLPQKISRSKMFLLLRQLNSTSEPIGLHSARVQQQLHHIQPAVLSGALDGGAALFFGGWGVDMRTAQDDCCAMSANDFLFGEGWEELGRKVAPGSS